MRTFAGQDIPRDRWKRPLILPPDYEGLPTDWDEHDLIPYTRMTTVIDCLDDKSALSKWLQRMCVIGLVERPDLILSVKAHRDDKYALDEICETAKEIGSASAKANIGTAFHKFTEMLDTGQPIEPDLPAEVVADLAAYQRGTAAMKMHRVETFRVLDEMQAAGTADRVIEYEGKHYIGDLKTGSLYGALKFAMQFAGYAYAKPYSHATGRGSDPWEIDKDRAILMHLAPGSANLDLYWVDLRIGLEALRIAKSIHAMRKRSKDVLTKIEQPDYLGSLIEQANTRDELTSLWQQFAHDWTPQHTERASARIAAMGGRA